MPLAPAPRLDRSYQEILSEALARVPVHNPEWTNFNDSDPGVTLLQLFAFMTENLLYRSNYLPANARRTFLRLLGIPLRPASAAEGVVTITNERGPLQTITLPRGITVQAGNIGFVTRNALDVLPIEGRLYIRRRVRAAEDEAAAQEIYQQVYGSYSEALEFYETVPVEAATADGAPTVNLGDDSTVDHSLWIALLARPGDRRLIAQARAEIAGKTLTLGLMPYLDQTERELRPGGRPAETERPLSFHISSDALDAGRTPRYERLDVRTDGNPLDELSLVQITLPARITTWENLDPLEPGVGDFPPSLEDDEDVSPRVLAWIRMSARVTAGATASALKARFSWGGVNAARIAQRVQVQAEPLGDADGTPDQVFTLANRPVITSTIDLFVAGERWRQIDDLLLAPAEVRAETASRSAMSDEAGADARVFVADRESGEIRMGNGLRGARPRGLVIASYAYGGGKAGDVNIGAIKSAPELPAGFKVTNPLPTRGGTEGETIEEAERAIPGFIRHASRAVTEQDFKDIIQRTPGVEVARTEILALYHPDYGSPAAGVVTVMVVPGGGGHAPVPDRFYLDAVCRHLDRARLVTTEVFVHGPHYVPISVSVGIEVVAGREIAPVREAVKAQIRRFLSPVTGGPEETGWPLGKAVEDRELFAAATRVEGVASVRNLRMWDEDSVPIVDRLPISGLQLPRLDRVLVSIGEPEDLTAAIDAPATEPTKRLPVPVLPAEC